jgi:hypothetical protein
LKSTEQETQGETIMNKILLLTLILLAFVAGPDALNAVAAKSGLYRDSLFALVIALLLQPWIIRHIEQ